MNPSQDFISDGEAHLQAGLLSGQAFQGLTVLRAANGDLSAKIDEAIAGLGLFLVVSIKGGPVPVSGDSENWDWVILVTENALLNRSAAGWDGKTARMLVEKIMVAGQTVTGCSMDTATEIAGEDGFVVWQIKGKLAVALPAAN